MVKVFPGFPSTRRRLETGIVRVAEIEINLEGAAPADGSHRAGRLCVGARKEAQIDAQIVNFR